VTALTELSLFGNSHISAGAVKMMSGAPVSARDVLNEWLSYSVNHRTQKELQTHNKQFLCV
jgi:hypothetical protein